MMDELIAHVSEKTGLTPEQTREAATAVIGFLKTRMPAPLASHLDGLLAGAPAGDANASGGETLASEAASLLNLFGKKE